MLSSIYQFFLWILHFTTVEAPYGLQAIYDSNGKFIDVRPGGSSLSGDYGSKKLDDDIVGPPGILPGIEGAVKLNDLSGSDSSDDIALKEFLGSLQVTDNGSEAEHPFKNVHPEKIFLTLVNSMSNEKNHSDVLRTFSQISDLPRNQTVGPENLPEPHVLPLLPPPHSKSATGFREAGTSSIDYSEEIPNSKTAGEQPTSENHPEFDLFPDITDNTFRSENERHGSKGEYEETGPLGMPPECFITNSGYICCNRTLQWLIFESDDQIRKNSYSECNMQIFVQTLERKAEKEFGVTFEIIVGQSDFASKTRFRNNLICKEHVGKRFILIYGTPEIYPLLTPSFSASSNSLD